MPLVIVAIAWLRKEDWPQWLAIDPNFQPDYDHWLKRMEKAVADTQKTGHLVEKIDVEPGEFLKWSRVNGGKVDSKARAAYAAMILSARHSSGH